MSRILLYTVILTICAFTACKRQKDATISSQLPPKEVVAYVDALPVTIHDIDAFMAVSQSGDMANQLTKALPNFKENSRKAFINPTIERILILKEAVKKGVIVTDDEVNLEYERRMKLPILAARGGISKERLKEELTLNKYKLQHIEPTIQINKTELESKIAFMRKMSARQERLHLRKIVFYLTAENDATKLIARANTLLEELNSGGATFEELAKAYSEDKQSAQTGGSIGFVNRMQVNIPEVWELNKGEVSKPLLSANMVALYKVEERQAMPGTSSEALEKTVERQLRAQKIEERMVAVMKDLRRNADVRIVN